MNKRPFGVTVLAALAVVAAVIAAIHTLQFLGILPFFLGPVSVRTFSLFYALMWGLMVWIYIWLVQMLWNVDRQAWLFLVIITIFNLCMDFVAVIQPNNPQDLGVSIFLNAIILIYCMLPSVRRSFQTV
jgi:hypothetical protein